MQEDRIGEQPFVIFEPDPAPRAEQIGAIEAEPDTQRERLDEEEGVKEKERPDARESLEPAGSHKFISV